MNTAYSYDSNGFIIQPNQVDQSLTEAQLNAQNMTLIQPSRPNNTPTSYIAQFSNGVWTYVENPTWASAISKLTTICGLTSKEIEILFGN